MHPSTRLIFSNPPSRQTRPPRVAWLCHRLNANRVRPPPYSTHFPSRNSSTTLAAVTVTEESKDAQRSGVSVTVATSSKKTNEREIMRQPSREAA